MSIDTLIPMASRVLFTYLYQIPLTTAISYNAVDIAVSCHAFKYLQTKYPERDWHVSLVTASAIGCLTGYYLSSGMDLSAAVLINVISTSYFATINRALAVPNAAV